MWTRTCAEYCHARNLDVVAVATRIEDALIEVATGHADVLVVPRPEDLFPLIQIVTAPTGVATAADRRPRRLR